MKKILLFCLSVIVCLCGTAQFRTDVAMPYRAAGSMCSGGRCVLDIHYNPDTAGLPVVVWFHGGGLTGGDRSAHASEYGGDPSAVFVAGHSAGGYLASMIGLDRSWLRKYGVEADSIAGIIPYSGQVITHFALRRSRGMSELQPSVDEFAPLYHVRKDAPPYIIITGDSEMELFGRYEENAYMWRMMKLVGHPDVRLYKLDGYNHGDMARPAHHILKAQIARILHSGN